MSRAMPVAAALPSLRVSGQQILVEIEVMGGVLTGAALVENGRGGAVANMQARAARLAQPGHRCSPTTEPS